MANTTVGASVQVEFASIGQMRKAIKEATSDLIVMQEQFGKTSPQAIEAAKKIADLKDRIEDAKEQADLFDPGKKFQAFTTAASQVAAGFSAVQGAMALVGAESEDVQKGLLKVQGALALSQGLSQLGDIEKSFTALNTAISSSTIIQKANAAATSLTSGAMRMLGISVNTTSTSFKVLRTAIITTGIGALVVGIGFAVEALMNFSSATDKAAERQKELEDQIAKTKEKLDDTIKSSQEYVDRQIQQTVIQEKIKTLSIDEQKNSKEILKLKKESLNLDIDGAKVEMATKQGLLTTQEELTLKTKIYQAEQEKVRLGLEAEKKASEELKNKREKDAQKIIKDKEKQAAAEKVLEDARLAMLSSRQRAEEEILKQFEERKKTLQAGGIKDFTAIEQQRDNELKALRKQFSDEDLKLAKDFEDQLTKITTDRRLASIKDARVKEIEDLKQGYEEQRKTIDENEKLTFEQRFILLASLKENERLAMQELEAKFAAEDNEKKIAKLEKELEEEGTTFDRKRAILDEEALLFQAQLDSKAISEEQYNEKVKALSDARIAINNEEVNAKLEAAQAISSILGNLSQLAGEQTEEGKALAIAQATIDTFVNAVKAYKSSLDIPIIGPYIAPVNAALAVAAGVAQIQQISAVQVPGGNGGGGASRPSISTGAPAGPAPNPTVVAQTLNTQAINQLGNQSMRAYVLNSDMQNNDQRNAYLQRNARIG